MSDVPAPGREPPSQPGEPEVAIKDARKAIGCLIYEVDPSIVRYVSAAVERAFTALRATSRPLPLAAPSEPEPCVHCDDGVMGRGDDACSFCYGIAKAQVEVLQEQLDNSKRKVDLCAPAVRSEEPEAPSEEDYWAAWEDGYLYARRHLSTPARARAARLQFKKAYPQQVTAWLACVRALAARPRGETPE